VSARMVRSARLGHARLAILRRGTSGVQLRSDGGGSRRPILVCEKGCENIDRTDRGYRREGEWSAKPPIPTRLIRGRYLRVVDDEAASAGEKRGRTDRTASP